MTRSNYRVHETEHTITTLILTGCVWFMSPFVPIEIPNGTFQSIAMALLSFVLIIVIAPYHTIKLPYVLGALSCVGLAVCEPFGIQPVYLLIAMYCIAIPIAVYVVANPGKVTKTKDHGKVVARKSWKVDFLLALPLSPGLLIGVPADLYRNFKMRS